MTDVDRPPAMDLDELRRMYVRTDLLPSCRIAAGHVRDLIAEVERLRASDSPGYQRAVGVVAAALAAAQAEPRQVPTERAGRITALGNVLQQLRDGAA